MGVPGKENLLSPVNALHYPAYHIRHDLPGLRRAQGARYKIILHVHNDQNLHLKKPPPTIFSYYSRPSP